MIEGFERFRDFGEVSALERLRGEGCCSFLQEHCFRCSGRIMTGRFGIDGFDLFKVDCVRVFRDDFRLSREECCKALSGDCVSVLNYDIYGELFWI